MSGIVTGKWKETDTATITITAPGTGRYLGLNHLTIIGDAAANLTIQSPSGTAIFQSELFAGGGGFIKDWNAGRELLGAENSALVIAVSAGTYKINVNGVTYG